ncbi:MAG TPA: nucleoside hydrolase [Miltoncostaeaceae bacterium]|nr:nucleoside hydrolase [Miltoncostaeaceae bacterium]
MDIRIGRLGGRTRRRAGLGAACATVLLLLGGVACGDGGGERDASPGREAAPTRVVVDTDLAPDDLVALAFLLSSPDATVVAVTVSGTGEVRCPAGLDVVRGLLAATGHEDVPTACGRSAPLAGDRTFPTGWRDAADDAWGLELPAPAPAPRAGSAERLLAESLAPGDLTLLTLGPLTNVAAAFRSDPGLADRVGSVVVMGGAVDVPGNVAGSGARAEWNMYIDPTAADEVLGSGAPVLMVGLDATRAARVTGDLVELMGANAHTAAASLARTLLVNDPGLSAGTAYLWDPTAAAIALDPGLAVTRSERIAVITGERPDAGATVRRPGGHPVTLAVGVDVPAVEDRLVRTLDGVAPGAPLAAPPAPVADIAIRRRGAVCTDDAPPTIPPGRVRITFASDAAGWSGVVVRLDGTLGMDAVLSWVERHPGETPVPGVGEAAFAGRGVTTFTDAVRGTALIVCAADDGRVEVAGTLVVR